LMNVLEFRSSAGVHVATAMPLIGAAFGHHGDLSAGVAAILGLVTAAENLELGYGIGADGDVLAAIGAVSISRCR